MERRGLQSTLLRGSFPSPPSEIKLGWARGSERPSICLYTSKQDSVLQVTIGHNLPIFATVEIFGKSLS